MQELLSQGLDELRGAARFKWGAVAMTWTICIVGWVVVMLLPAKFEATARIFVDTRTALSPVIAGLAIQQDMSAHLNLAQQTITSRAQLQKIARETGLEGDAVTPRERTRVIGNLRGGISLGVEQTRVGTQMGGAIYSISYRDPDRGRSIKVVEMLLDSFVEETLGGKRVSSETAREFLSKEIADTEARLGEAEQRLADFRKNNVGMMPGTDGDYFTRLQNEMDLARAVRAELGVATARKQELESQLRGESPFSVVGGPGMGDARVSGADTSTLIAEAERRLSALLLRYTERHPDVQSAREEIETLKRRREAELEALRRGDAGAALSSGASANPVYQNIQLALNAADVRISELRGQLRQHEQRIAELQRLVTTMPDVEAELARLNRDYEVTRTQYTALVERLQRAELGQEAENMAAVRFEIIEPPNAAFRPVTPRRPMLVVAVLLAAVGVAVGLAWALNKLKPVFGRSHELFEATGLPILGEVSMTNLESRATAVRRTNLILSVHAAGLMALFSAVLFVSFRYSFGL